MSAAKGKATEMDQDLKKKEAAVIERAAKREARAADNLVKAEKFKIQVRTTSLPARVLKLIIS